MKWPDEIEIGDVRNYVGAFLAFCDKRLYVRGEYPLAETPGVLPEKYRHGEDQRSRWYAEAVHQVFDGEPPGGIYGDEVGAAIVEQRGQFKTRLQGIVRELGVRETPLHLWASSQPSFVEAVRFLKRNVGDETETIDLYVLEVFALALGRLEEVSAGTASDYLRSRFPSADRINELARLLSHELEPLSLHDQGIDESLALSFIEELQTITEDDLVARMPKPSAESPRLRSLKGIPEREIVLQTMIAGYADKFLPRNWWKLGETVPAVPIVNLMSLLDPDFSERSFYRGWDRFKEQRGYGD